MHLRQPTFVLLERVLQLSVHHVVLRLGLGRRRRRREWRGFVCRVLIERGLGKFGVPV